jgi:hypothetical protein
VAHVLRSVSPSSYGRSVLGGLNALFEQLRHHARREEALAYRWAEATFRRPSSNQFALV